MSPSNILMALVGIGVAFWFLMGMKDDTSAPKEFEAAKVRTVPKSTGLPLGAKNLAGDKPRPETAAEVSYNGEYGFSAGKDGLMAANRQMYFVQDALTPETLPYLTEQFPVPAEYHILPAPESCDLRPLGEGEELANAFMYIPPSQASTGLHAITLERFATETEKWIRSARVRRDVSYDNSKARLRTNSSHGSLAWQPMENVNVFVGRTEKPVYLLLQAGNPNTIFNVIAAEDARIAHVAVLSNGVSAVALPNSVDSLEIVDTRRANCGWQPVQEPQATWGALTGREKISEDRATWFYKTYFAYSGWFRDMFNQDPKDGVIGGNTGYHLLVGHMPTGDEPRFFYRPISQSTVYISEEEVILAGTDDAIADTMAEMQRDAVAAFLGGDLSRLIPPNVPAELPAPLVPQEVSTADAQSQTEVAQ